MTNFYIPSHFIEAKIKEAKPRFSKTYQQPTTRHYPPSSQLATKNNSPTQTSSLNPTPKPPLATQSKLPIKNLTPGKMQDRRAQGLCYNCDDKFFASHKCTSSRFLLLLVDELEEEPTPNLEEEAIAIDQEDTYFQLSPQALIGQFSPQTLKFHGLVGGP